MVIKLQYVLIYLIVTNITAFLLFGADKHRAKKGKWRIKEASLFAVAFFGGSIGALLGMRIFHHKTKKTGFVVGIPALFVINIVIVTYILTKI